MCFCAPWCLLFVYKNWEFDFGGPLNLGFGDKIRDMLAFVTNEYEE